MSLINEHKVGDVAPVHLEETYRICVGIAPLILTVDFMELSGQHCALFDMIYLLTAIGLSPGGSSTVQYTFTHKQFTERHKTNNT